MIVLPSLAMKTTHTWVMHSCKIFLIIGMCVLCEGLFITSPTESLNCVIPLVEGTKYSYADPNNKAVLSPGSRVAANTLVKEDCEEGFYNTFYGSNVIGCSIMFSWIRTYTDTLCLKKCQALTADSLSTLAASCTVKPGMPRIGVENPVELHCLSGGQLRGDLYTCNSENCYHFSAKCDGVVDCLDGSDEDNCFNSTTTVKTSITHGKTQLRNSPVTQKECVIPNVEGTIYSFNNSNEIAVLSAGSLVRPNRLVEENCEKGYHKSLPYSFKMCSEDGNWVPLISHKLCSKECQPLASDSLDFKCTLNGKTVECSKPSTPGTTLTTSCKVTHGIPNGYVESPVELVCGSDGKWEGGQLYQCTPNCGRRYVPSKPTIVHGDKASYGAAPWNVGIYRKDEQNSYMQICGGSLITQNLVVTAAHCFGYTSAINRIFWNSDALYKIAVGKYDRNISVIDNDFTQIMDVGLIEVNNNYFGINGNHANDIAIVVLSKKVQLSAVVMPVCIDWTGKHTELNGALGLVCGWGRTENTQVSPILLEAKLSYIDRDTCLNMFPDDFQKFVAPDKFCAGSKLGPGVNSGDSGAGLTFSHDNAFHYLTGVASVKNPKESESIAVFTNVAHHISWIRTLLSLYSYSNNNKTG